VRSFSLNLVSLVSIAVGIVYAGMEQAN